MKQLYTLLVVTFFFTSCLDNQTPHSTEVDNKIVLPEFQTIIDSAHVNGAVLIYDLQEEKYYSNDFVWANKGQLPASTFKIPNSIIALETGIMQSDSTLIKWNGEKRGNINWEQDLIFKEAFHYSCVPCYQEIAHKIGYKAMREYVDLYNYGTIKVDSTTIDNFWLVGESRINQFEQLDFLQSFYHSTLPISKRTDSIMKKIIVLEETNQYKISGKTGWSFDKGIDNGWFVGYIETKGLTYLFATNIEPKENLDMNKFPRARKDITYQALRHLKIIE